METPKPRPRNKCPLCPMCSCLLEDTRVLPCDHTFCKECLKKLLKSTVDLNQFRCPICKDNEVLSLPDGDVIEFLPKNAAVEAKVERFKKTCLQGPHACTVCDASEDYPAETYCVTCNDFLCFYCQMKHGKCKQNLSHMVFSVNQDTSEQGDQISRGWQKCATHATEDERFVCLDCKDFMCQLCLVLLHAKHQTISSEEHKQRQRRLTEDLHANTEVRVEVIDKHIAFVKEKQMELGKIIEAEVNKIVLACDEVVQRVTERRDQLVGQCKKFFEDVKEELDRAIEDDSEAVDQLKTGSEVIINRVNNVVDWDSFKEYQKLCLKHTKLLEKPVPDFDKPAELAKRIKELKFQRSTDKMSIELGTVEVASTWEIATVKSLSRRNVMGGATAVGEGKLAVGLKQGGIQYIHSDGSQNCPRDLKSIKISDLGCLSDGRIVVRNTVNKLSIFKPNFEKMGVRFDTLGPEAGNEGGLDVDREDSKIYVAYKGARLIQVFRAEGGRALHDVVCEGFLIPEQICVATGPDRLLIAKSGFSLKAIDVFRQSVVHCITKAGAHPYPTVCRDNTVLVAWMSHESGLLSVEKYSQELTHLRTLVRLTNFPKSRKKHWYYLVEINSHLIALCTPDEVYLLCEQAGWVIE